MEAVRFGSVRGRSTTRSVRVTILGGKKRSWRVRLAPKLRRLRLASPVRIWYRFKKMMLRLSNGADTGERRIPKARDRHVSYTRTEFENRLILEIYKSMAASLELGYTKS